jgi:hypothetical protein
VGSGSYIRLDPDVADGGNINQIPLSDLYGVPVFTEDIDRKAGERRKDRQDALAHIRREVFGVRKCSEDEMIRQIRSQIFQGTQEYIVSGPAENAEMFSKTGFLPGFSLIGIFILLPGIRKIRRLGIRMVETLRR